MKNFKLLLLCILAGCTTTRTNAPVVNLDYRSEPPIYLDVATITVVNVYTPLGNNRLLPASMVHDITEWAETRFVAGGTKGTAVIKILNAAVNEKRLVAKDEVNALLNNDLEPMEYGANISLEMEIAGSTPYVTGQVHTDVSRHVTVDTDVLLGFDKTLWADFKGKIINSLDRQVLADINLHLSKLVMATGQAAIRV